MVLMSVSMSGLGKSLDGILNVDRYYLITEYIYDQYRLFYKSDDLEIWCLKERFDEMYQRLQIDLGDASTSFSDPIHQLGAIPYIWANYDEVHVDEYETYSLEEVKKEKMVHAQGDYLLLNIDSDSRSDRFAIEIQYQNGSDEKYFLNVMEGKHDYKIRISTDYDWHESRIVGIHPLNDDGIKQIEYAFCKGDLLDK